MTVSLLRGSVKMDRKEQARKIRQSADEVVWRTMMIERQFRPRVEEYDRAYDEPATLTYLRTHLEEYEPEDQSAMGATLDFLENSLYWGLYSKAISVVVIGIRLSLDAAAPWALALMHGLTLASPDALMEKAKRFAIAHSIDLPDPDFEADDPWQDMAVERQYRKLVDYLPDEPATLTYLLEHKEEFSSDPGERLNMNRVHNIMTMAFWRGVYAKTLAIALWGDSVSVPLAMRKRLGDPEDLLSAMWHYNDTWHAHKMVLQSRSESEGTRQEEV